MLTVQGLTKTFPNGKGIFDVSFSIQKGEVFGFLGPNGAGKSTTIRHIMGFMRPDQGEITVNGMDVRKHQGKIQRHIGYLPGEIAFIEGMTGKTFLDFMADMQEIKDTAKRDKLIDRLQFDVHTPIRKMSKGMKQKVGIVAAFMHSPEVIILDEPTSGLDPLMQKVFIDIVLEEKANGTTFLMSSHSFPEIERTCDRAAIIKDGRLIAVKDIHELQTMQRKVFEVTFENEADIPAFIESGLQIESRQGNRVKVAVLGNHDRFIKEAAKYRVRHIDVSTQSLEEVFMNYYDRKGAAK
ncbi:MULTISPECIES: ABC transporter ATP-binding protein [Bacillus]|uniref:ABC transporter ATP-binding protein n=1 Tax=Bacillus glycinifermentans TaxID=1664069 RepID=A0AAJ4D0Y9_9BACI|nr:MULTISPECIES: ABC transporter ATP-binding protein [Bacillus]KKB73670.1 ABC transporter ATP-binding protein [Bacillus sp. TH008]MDU0072346.1 ABC transporter ATP-binding protein [Bacillus sp. IG6]MED8020139.1 ABC transporter ATP-binding protein [Bacillus glycinifermentans]QAT63823.1 ABC transporter ATP-binding protein [Bacillus glycinifermentans]WKB77700.1 ABC transporter ATP-binding protein [Bacillus glycinifermentans]